MPRVGTGELLTLNQAYDRLRASGLEVEIRRGFHAADLDEKWPGDITCVQVCGSWLYLACVIDIWTRRVLVKVTAKGTVRVDLEEHRFDGIGWRDHSRGPRGGGQKPNDGRGGVAGWR